jgi:hypothetical protein
MAHDEDGHKGTAVTKPIDLRAKKTGVPIRRREKPPNIDPKADLKEIPAAKAQKSMAGISAIVTPRARKAPKPEIIELIGQRLRGVYNDVLMQPIPDRFIELVQQLDGDSDLGEPKTGSKKEAK